MDVWINDDPSMQRMWGELYVTRLADGSFTITPTGPERGLGKYGPNYIEAVLLPNKWYRKWPTAIQVPDGL